MSLLLRSALTIVMSTALTAAMAAAAPAAQSPAGGAPTPAPPCVNSSADCLEKIASLYLAALASHDGSKLPLAPDVRRTENALTNAKGAHQVRESFERTRMVEGLRDARYYVDPVQGEVVVFFRADIDLKEADAGTTTKAGDAEYKVAVTVPQGTYTTHEAERFKIVRGLITEIEIIAHVETGKGAGSGWPNSRNSGIEPGAAPK